MPPDPRSERPQISEAQRAAALRALRTEQEDGGPARSAPETTPVFSTRSAASSTSTARSGAGAAGDDEGQRPPTTTAPAGEEEGGHRSWVGLLAVVATVVVVAVVAAVVLLGGRGDDTGTTEAGAPPSVDDVAEPSASVPGTATPPSTAPSTSSTATTAPSTTAPAGPEALPAPVGYPLPQLDLATDDIAALADQTITLRLWLYGNPTLSVAEAATVEGSQARDVLVNELALYEGAGRVGVFEGYRADVGETASDGATATASWVESFDQLVVFDAATGEMISETPGTGPTPVQAHWVRSFDGRWLLDRLEVG